MAELFDSLSGLTAVRTLVQYLIAFCSRAETASDVLSDKFEAPVVSDKLVEFRGPCLNRSWEIPREAIGGGTFDVFFRDNFRPEIVSDVISSVAQEWAGMGVPVKFGDSMSKRFQDIWDAHFVMGDERRWRCRRT